MNYSKIFRTFLTASVILIHATVCFSQQKILLIGTQHETPDDRREEIIPIAKAVENFNPGIICVEYLMPTDTASLKFKNEEIFQQREEWRQRWEVPAGDMFSMIESLQREPGLSSDILKQLQLQRLYYLSVDFGNSDYWGYRIMSTLEKNPEKIESLKKTFLGFKMMQANYDYKMGNNKPYQNNEYYRLVFPLAIKLNVSRLYPIDDLSTWKEYEKYYNRLNPGDTTDITTMKHRRRVKNFLTTFFSIPSDSNRWLFANSPQVMQELFYVDGYYIDKDNSNEDIKMQHYYWVLRNKEMAQYIDDVARGNPDINLVVFFGASHVGSVLEELNKLHPTYQVLTLYDIMK